MVVSLGNDVDVLQKGPDVGVCGTIALPAMNSGWSMASLHIGPDLLYEVDKSWN